MSAMDKWEGLVAVVTGASSGIGRATAIKLADHGMKVAALARRVDRLEELSSSYSGKGEVVGIECDVTDTGKVEEVFERIVAEMGPIRVLVNNAGIGIGSKFGDFEIDKWRKMFDVNVFGMFTCTKQVMRSVKQNASQDLVHIININSIAGYTEFETNTDIYPYSATKHVVSLLTKGLIKQVAMDNMNVRVTSLNPGIVRTEIFEVGDFFKEEFANLPGLQSEDVAEACVAVLSAGASVLISNLTVKPMGELL